MNTLRPTALAVLLALGMLAAPAARAALFEDDEARRAILDLRQKVDAQRVELERQGAQLRQAADDGAQLRRSLLELQQQIEVLRGELARARGQDEETARALGELQRRQKDLLQGVEERLRKMEPAIVVVDGREFSAEPAEQREFEAALAVFRKGDFDGAQAGFGDFLRRYPASGYRPSALFWLGNARYATRDYKEAIGNFRALLQAAPDHARAPEAVLSIANCQLELKDRSGARQTLADLVKNYPQSEAAAAARERLAKLK